MLARDGEGDDAPLVVVATDGAQTPVAPPAITGLQAWQPFVVRADGSHCGKCAIKKAGIGGDHVYCVDQPGAITRSSPWADGPKQGATIAPDRQGVAWALKTGASGSLLRALRFDAASLSWQLVTIVGDVAGSWPSPVGTMPTYDADGRLYTAVGGSLYRFDKGKAESVPLVGARHPAAAKGFQAIVDLPVVLLIAPTDSKGNAVVVRALMR